MQKKEPLVSIIIRTKNEERWINLCLDKIFSQTYKNYEIIIVDNYSKDKSLLKLKDYKVKKIVKIKKYLPGKALNLGIKHSKGKFLVFISAHCIPKNIFWLSNLLKNLIKNNDYAGVYGRQEPMNFTSNNDSRDLFLLFGLDKKIQKKDSFFHNANSCIRRDVWNLTPFDNKCTNIEDRLWASNVIKKGYKLCYEPSASVYHYHGVHQNNNDERLSNVVKIVNKNIYKSEGRIHPNNLKIVASIPIKGLSKKFKNKHLLGYTVSSLKKSKYVTNIFVSTDNIKTQNIAKKLGVRAPFLRSKKYSSPSTNLENVQQHTINMLEKKLFIPDLFLHIEETFPFRDENLIDNMIERLLNKGFDTVIAARKEFRVVWQDNKDEVFRRIDSGDKPRKYKESMMIGYPGLACVTYPEFVRNGKLIGNKIGLFEVDNQVSFIEVRSANSVKQAEKFIKL